jgi:AraC family transcriptional regulator, transcriptional activator of pobA
MKYTYSNNHTKATIELHSFSKNSFEFFGNEIFYTIVFNPNEEQHLLIDAESISIPKNGIITILPEQRFSIPDSEKLIIWRYNSEFYCMFHHDEEVSCAGFLFYGASLCCINLSLEESDRLVHLHDIFIEEFDVFSTAQEEMLRVLLVRMIIKLTRLAKIQFFQIENVQENKFRLYRSFNLLVEEHFKKEHSVKFYAYALNKSPKTITNLFIKHHFPSPQKVIHNRIVIEAKRLLLYSDKSIKEISYELHFEEPSHFSKFFKKITGVSPLHFKSYIGKEVS